MSRSRGVVSPPLPRFWAKVDKEGPNGCWLWTGARNETGYGVFVPVGSRTVKAHRWLWEQQHGPLPLLGGYHKACLCHTCDNPGCVNLTHLFIGTHADNMRDMVAKKRNVHGERTPTRVLTEPQVLEIKRKLANGEQNRPLGEEYGVSRTTILHIKKGIIWKHVKLT